MSKMGTVFLELSELGSSVVRIIEDEVIHKVNQNQEQDEILNFISNKYNLSLGASLIIISGAKNYQSSKAIAFTEDDHS